MTIIIAALLTINPMFAQQNDATYWTTGVTANATANRTTEHSENTEASQDWNVPQWAQCPDQWHNARMAGWAEDQMPTLDYIMHRESRCTPSVVNYLGCKGLLQLCNWKCKGSCLEAIPNLEKGYELWEQSGWRPWCLDGDRVTGSC